MLYDDSIEPPVPDERDRIRPTPKEIIVMQRCHYFVAGFVSLVLSAALTVVVTAHLAVSKTMPANDSTVTSPPTSVQVWFTQQPSQRVSLLAMKGPSGDVSLGDLQINREDRSIAAAVRGPLAPGRYEVTWRTAGDDGHVMRGTFAFSVEKPD